MRLRPLAAIALVFILFGPFQASSASSSSWMTPANLRAAYDVNPLLDSGYTGKGVTVAVINTGVDSSFYSDIAGFDTHYGLPAAQISVATPSGSTGTDSETPSGETTADVEFVHAMAPDANILLVLTGTAGLSSGFSYVLDNRVAAVATVSPSWAWWGQGAQQTVQGENAEYAKSVHENITLIAASNDWGSNNSVPWGTINGGFWYDYLPDSYLMPQYSPYFTAVGGTNLYLDAAGNYMSETGWNQSGGGPSNLFQQPGWQAGVGVPRNGMRDIPDIALDASCVTPYAFYWKGSPYYYFCGTSAAAPTFAGIVADIDQAAGRDLGFLNPSLYLVASSDPAAFHDVTSGCSVVAAGSTTMTGYCAAVGWDYVTGLGSVDAARLAKDFAPGATFVTTTTTTQSSSTSSITFSTTTFTYSSSSTTYTVPSTTTTSTAYVPVVSTTNTAPGGIPEFPYQVAAVVVLTLTTVVAYAAARRRKP